MYELKIDVRKDRPDLVNALKKVLNQMKISYETVSTIYIVGFSIKMNTNDEIDSIRALSILVKN